MFTVLDCVLADPPAPVGGTPEWHPQLASPAVVGHPPASPAVVGHPPRRFVALDMLAWRGVALEGATTECRLFWLASRLQEAKAEAETTAQHRESSIAEEATFEAAAWAAAEPPRLAAAARAGVSPAVASGDPNSGVIPAPPSPQDGLLLLHARGVYTPGRSPLALAWRDAGCSSYAPPSPAPHVDQTHPHRVFLSVGPDGDALETSDEPPIVLGSLRSAASFTAPLSDTPCAPPPQRVRAGDVLALLRRSDGALVLDGRAPHKRRGGADCASAIAFAAAARAGAGVTLQQLLDAAAGDGEPEGGEEAVGGGEVAMDD